SCQDGFGTRMITKAAGELIRVPEVAVGMHYLVQCFSGCRRHFVFEASYLDFHCADCSEHRQRLVAHGQIALKCWLLFKKTDAKASKQNNLSSIGFLLPGDQSEDGRFAGAVAPNKPDALARVYLKTDAAQDFGGAV